MGVKRGKGVASRSADKRLRQEAGLDLAGAGEGVAEEAKLGLVVREVWPPRPVQAELQQWVEQLCTSVRACPLPAANPAALLLPGPEPGPAYTGGTGASCRPVGPLAAGSLVFPSAVGRLHLSLESGNWNCSLAQLASHLTAQPALATNVQFFQGLFDKEPGLQLRPAGKLGRHLTVELAAGPGPGEADTLAAREPYKTADTAVRVWARQRGLHLPPGLAATLLLHCRHTGLTSDNMTAWQVVRRLWSTLAGLGNLEGKQLILGLVEPVPGPGPSPLLDRDGQTVLYPGLARPQWAALTEWAGRAAGLEAALLTGPPKAALYDTVFTVSGAAGAGAVQSSLARGLGGRVVSLALLGGRRAWSPGEPARFTLQLGVRLEPTKAGEPCTLGPPAASKEAADFRAWWGDRAELRRFPDGAVREAVVWGGEGLGRVGEVVRAVVARHHKGCEVEEEGDWGEALLVGDGGAATRAELDRLTPLLYGLAGLPLGVAGVAAVGQQMRLSAVGQLPARPPGGKVVRGGGGAARLVPRAGMAAQAVAPLDVVLVPEQSGKWPRQPAALARVRTAWLCAVGRALVKTEPSVRAEVQGERLVLLSRGQVVRCSAGPRGPECELGSWLAGLAGQFPAWSGAVRLAQRWLAAHLLSHLPAVAVEVTLAAILLAAPAPPSRPTPAFLLWLHTLASHDWNSEPLVCPGSETTLARTSLPPLAVLCPHSPSPSHWTRVVTWPELQRMVSLATQALSSPSLACFAPSYASYEALIHLRPLQVATRHLALAAVLDTGREGATPVKNAVNEIPILDHDPVRLLVARLQTAYTHLANFYYDKFGGTVIAVKVTGKGTGGGRMVSEEGKLVTNWGVVVEDWEVLGEGLVKEVELINSDLLL